MEVSEVIKSLDQDLPVYEDYLKEISEQVLNEKVSKYPLFIAHKEDAIALGRPIIIKERAKTAWSINASIAEELFSKNILGEDKLEEFKKAYKDPQTHVLFFILTPEEMKFLFRPYTTKRK